MTGRLGLTVAVSAALAVVQLLIRLVQRQSFLGALTGLLSVGICLVAAWLTRDARNYYLPGFLTNGFWIIVLGASLLARMPGIGLLVEYLRRPVVSGWRQWLASWRGEPELVRAYTQATLVWIAVFALRLLIQVPLYLTGSVGFLGAARLILGLPLFALGIWVSWLLIGGPYHRRQADQEVHVDHD